MIAKSFTLQLDGDVSLERLTTALETWRHAMDAIGDQVGVSHMLGSTVTDLQLGSAIVGVSMTFDAPQPADAFSDLYDQLGQRARGSTLPGFPSALERWVAAIRNITTLDGGRGLTLASDSADTYVAPISTTEFVTTTRAVAWAAPTTQTEAFGIIGGKLQSLSSRKGLHVVLYDDLFDRAVRCIMPPDQHESLRELWDRDVLIEGLVRRDSATGRPLSIRNIRSVIGRTAPVDRHAWLKARGALKDVSPDVTSEDMIRRIRNG